MINTLSLLFSLIAVVVVVARAAMLDRVLPWFKPVPGEFAQPRPKVAKGPRR